MKVMLTCVSWYSIAVHIECDIVKWMLTAGNAVVLEMVYLQVSLLSVAFRRLYYVRTH